MAYGGSHNLPVLFGGGISADERKLRTLRSLTNVLQKTIRILSGKSTLIVSVANDESTPHPAWTEYNFGAKPNRVLFNLPHVGNIDTPQDVVRITGLAHHERCHATYTPGVAINTKDPIGRVLHDRGRLGEYAFYVLEDQRVESIDVAMLPAMRHYYSATVAGYIMGQDDEMDLAWLLVYGRRYLGSEVIDALEATFKHQDKIEDFKRIIDGYRRLNLFHFGDKARAGMLVEEFCDLIEDMGEQPEYPHPQSCSGHGGAGDASDKAQAEAGQAKVAAQMADEEDDEEDDGGSNGGGGGSDDDEDEDDGDGDGDDEEDNDDSDSNDGGDSGGGQGQGAGTGTRPDDADSTDPIQDAKDALNNLFTMSVNDPAIQAEVRNGLQAMAKGVGRTTDITQHNGWDEDTRPDAVTAARQLSRRLERIRDDMDPGWDSHQFAGRLNMGRAISARNPLGDIWDQWNEGKVDSTDVETVVIADQSGSMGNHVRQLSDAVWSIKHGHDKIGAACTVWGFDTRGFLIYDAADKAQPGVFPRTPAMGGTNPSDVILEASRVLATSKRKRKIFIALTDGEWYGHGAEVDDTEISPNDMIAQMNGAGVLTAMVYLTGAYDMRNFDPSHIEWHNTQIHRVMSDLTNFGPFGDELLRMVMKK